MFPPVAEETVSSQTGFPLVAGHTFVARGGVPVSSASAPRGLPSLQSMFVRRRGGGWPQVLAMAVLESSPACLTVGHLTRNNGGDRWPCVTRQLGTEFQTCVLFHQSGSSLGTEFTRTRTHAHAVGGDVFRGPSPLPHCV